MNGGTSISSTSSVPVSCGGFSCVRVACESCAPWKFLMLVYAALRGAVYPLGHAFPAPDPDSLSGAEEFDGWSSYDRGPTSRCNAPVRRLAWPLARRWSSARSVRATRVPLEARRRGHLHPDHRT